MTGWHGDAVKIRLAAPPVDGAANAALVAFLAERIGLPRAAVTVVAGTTSRRKRVAIVGRSLEEVLAEIADGSIHDVITIAAIGVWAAGLGRQRGLT